jgi:aconitase B
MSEAAPLSAIREMVHLPLSALIEDPNNLKEHDERQLSSLMASIQSAGFADPVGVVESAEEPGRYNLLEGHGRVMAARRLGLATVPVFVQESLSKTERRAYAIAHNMTQMSTGLDMSAVSEEFDRLSVTAGDYSATGFTGEDIAFLAPATTGVDADAVKFDASGQNREAWKPYVDTQHTHVLNFATEAEQLAFYDFIDWLRGQFPSAPTIGDRLIAFVDAYEDHAGC